MTLTGTKFRWSRIFDPAHENTSRHLLAQPVKLDSTSAKSYLIVSLDRIGSVLAAWHNHRHGTMESPLEAVW